MTFHELYTCYYPRAYRFVKSYINDPQASEDIVSEGMIKVWQNYDKTREDTLLPFLFTILRNKSLDYLKSSRIKLSKERTSEINWQLEDLELRLSSLSNTVENDIFSTEINEIVSRTLDKMPQKTKEIFKYSRLEGKSYLEISRIFDISDKGVEYHMSVAIRMLKEALKDYLPSFYFV